MSSKSSYDFLSIAGGLARKVLNPVEALDLKRLSTELVDGIIARAAKQKDVIIAIIANEVSKFFQRIDVAEELKKVAEDLEVEVHAVLNFRKHSTGKSISRIERKVKIFANGKKGRR